MGKGVAVKQNIAYPIILRKPTNMNFLFLYSPSIPNLPDFARWLMCADRWPKTKLGKGRGPSERLRSVCFQRPRGLIRRPAVAAAAASRGGCWKRRKRGRIAVRGAFVEASSSTKIEGGRFEKRERERTGIRWYKRPRRPRPAPFPSESHRPANHRTTGRRIRYRETYGQFFAKKNLGEFICN